MAKKQERAEESTGPRFVRCLAPVLLALRDLGGSGRPEELEARVAGSLHASEAELAERTRGGWPKFSKNVHWARLYLAKAGLIDASRRGVWSLTDGGWKTDLSPAVSQDLFKRVHRESGGPRQPRQAVAEPELEDEVPTPSEGDHRDRFLGILKRLPATGFEHLCQRLLREAAFEQVVVTGKSGDGGIDGHGLLQVNPLVSFRVLFQCKRYEKPVSPGCVRDFRGAMQGRADKGIILTTSTFTSEARHEAMRDGVTPIELVDGEKLVEMFEKLEFGLVPRTAFDVDEAFFEQFDIEAKSASQRDGKGAQDK